MKRLDKSSLVHWNDADRLIIIINNYYYCFWDYQLLTVVHVCTAAAMYVHGTWGKTVQLSYS